MIVNFVYFAYFEKRFEPHLVEEAIKRVQKGRETNLYEAYYNYLDGCCMDYYEWMSRTS